MKLTAKLLTLILALSMFAGCGSKDKKDEDVDVKEKVEDVEKDDKKDSKKEDKKSKTDEDLVKDVAEGYLDACCDFDIKGTLDYIDPDSEMYSSHSEMDADEYINSVIPTEAAMMLGEDGLDNLIDEILAMMSYEIEDVEIDGEKATVEYVMSAPDFENLELDEEKMASDLGLEDEEAMKSKMMKILGVKTEEEAENKMSSMSSDEQMEFMSKVMEEFGIIDYVVDVMKDADKTETDGTIEFQKIDGEWLIVEDK